MKDPELLVISQFVLCFLPSVLLSRTFEKVRKLDTDLWTTTRAGGRMLDNRTLGTVQRNVLLLLLLLSSSSSSSSYLKPQHHPHHHILNLNVKVNYSDTYFSLLGRHHIRRERESGNCTEFRNCWQKIHRKTIHILWQQKGYTPHRNRLTS